MGTGVEYALGLISPVAIPFYGVLCSTAGVVSNQTAKSRLGTTEDAAAL